VTILKNPKESKKAFLSSFYEFEIGRKLKHPGIVQYLNFVRIGPHWQKASDENDEFHILIEYMPGKSLQTLLEKQRQLISEDLPLIHSIMSQVINALAFLHEQKIVHQDLKPENILFSQDMKTVKLCDFGISTSLDKTRKTNKANLGTPAYMPPEQLQHILTSKFDVWSLGCVLLQILTGKEPFFTLKEEFKISLELLSKKNTPLSFLEQNYKHLLYGEPGTPGYMKTLYAQNENLRNFLFQCFKPNY
jgi:serine/threonine protein kinase